MKKTYNIPTIEMVAIPVADVVTVSMTEVDRGFLIDCEDWIIQLPFVISKEFMPPLNILGAAFVNFYCVRYYKHKENFLVCEHFLVI